MIIGVWWVWARVMGVGFAYGLGRFLRNVIRVLLIGFLRFFFFKLKGGLENGWISDRVQPAFRLWFALVGRFVDPAFFQKRPAIETIETIETIEMIEMFSAPLAGDSLRRGLGWGVELVIFGIWRF